MKTINTYYTDYTGLLKFVQNNQQDFFDVQIRSILVQVFSGCSDHSYLVKLSTEISKCIPGAKVIGTTTSGGIMDGQVSGLQTILSFSIFYHTIVRTAVFSKRNQSDFELGQSVAIHLGSDAAKLVILFSTGHTVDANDLLKGIQNIHPGLPIAGGNAGNSTAERRSLLVCGDQVIESGVAGLVLESDNLSVNCYSHLGWQPIGKEMSITEAEGSRVYSIDNLPAFTIYQKYLGLDEKDFLNSLEYPLIVKRNGVQVARTPVSYYEDNSLQFAGELATGEKVRLSFGHIDMIARGIADLCLDIKQIPAESIYVYSCESRRGFLQEHSKMETEPLQQIAPTSGFYTLGEFFHSGQVNQLLNGTMTVVVLAEKDRSTNFFQPFILEKDTELGKNHDIPKDKVAERSTGVLKALTHLVNMVTTELVAANAKLKYISMYDALTGLYNRTAFEEELQKREILNAQTGIIVCDLDFLKMINDNLGHDIGDTALKLAAEAISAACAGGNMIARIGGDEFAVIVPNATLSLLKEYKSKIMMEASNKRLPPKDLPLYLSVGTALAGHGQINNIKDAFKVADKNMYSLKFDRKKAVRKRVLEHMQAAT